MTYRIWANGLQIEILDLRIRDQNNTFSKASFTTINSSANLTACNRGKIVWIFDSDVYKFVGEVTSYEEDKKLKTLTVYCLDASYRLYKRNSGERKSWTDQTLATIVADHITPATGKTKQFGYLTPDIANLSWTNDYGNALTSLAHLVQSLHADWYMDAGVTNLATVATVVSETVITLTGLTFTANEAIESFLYFRNGAGIGHGAMVSSCAGGANLTCLNATFISWGIQAGDSIQFWRITGGAPTTDYGYRFRIELRRGSAASAYAPTETIDLRHDVADGSSRKSEKFRNIVYLLGAGSGTSQYYTKTMHATLIRSKLALDITSSITAITLDDVTDFPASGTVMIGMEKVTYTSISTVVLMGCTRGVDAGTGTPALLSAYPHIAGIEVVLYATGGTTYNEATPQTGSSIEQYGVNEYGRTYPEINHQNQLDGLAQSLLKQFMTSRDEGSYRLNRLLSNAKIGDNITLTNYEGVSSIHRLLAIEYNWKTDNHTVEILERNDLDLNTESLGLTDEGITSVIADLRDEITKQSAAGSGGSGCPALTCTSPNVVITLGPGGTLTITRSA